MSKKNPSAGSVPETPETAAQGTKQNTSPNDRKHRARMRALRSLIIRFVLFLLVIYVLFVHIIGVTVMPNGDMYPRIDAGDLVIYYRLDHSFYSQDVVALEKPTESLNQTYAEKKAVEQETAVTKSFIRRALDWLGFKDPAEPEKTLFVCRVVARPGDTVEISDAQRLVVNGNTIIESNIFYQTPEYDGGYVEYPLTLGDDEYFVLADYRKNGADSRFFGAVREDEILGTVITIMRRNNL